MNNQKMRQYLPWAVSVLVGGLTLFLSGAIFMRMMLFLIPAIAALVCAPLFWMAGKPRMYFHLPLHVLGMTLAWLVQEMITVSGGFADPEIPLRWILTFFMITIGPALPVYVGYHIIFWAKNVRAKD